MKPVKEILKKMFPKFAQSHRIRRLSNAEQETKLLPILCDKDKIAIDIGANLGLYVHHFTSLCSRVVAFEPIPILQEHLRRHYPSTQIEGVALSDVEGNAQLRMPKGNYSWATIAPTNTLSLADPNVGTTLLDVPVRVLDSYSFQNVGIVKIDVEGHEEKVLRGGIKFFLENRPNVIVEVEERHNTGSVKAVFDLMVELGYEGFYLDGHNFCPMSSFQASRDQQLSSIGTKGRTGRYINNFIFIPADKAALVLTKWRSRGAAERS